MRTISLAIFTLLLFLVPTTASAQVNYDLLPGDFVIEGDKLRWSSVVLNRRDSKLYLCEVNSTRERLSITLTCNPNYFSATALNGNNVVTIPSRSTDAANPSNWFDFWQIDRSTGAVQFCYAGATQGTPSCATFKIP